MANTPATRTTIANILKQMYADGITAATKKQVVLLELLERTAGKMSYGGESFIIPLEFNQMDSTGAREEDGTLPAAIPASWQRTVVPIYSNYFTITATGLSMATTKTDPMSFARIWGREAYIKTRAFRQHLNRQLNGDGNGILAQVDGTPSIGGTYTTVTLDNAYGLSGYNNSAVNGHRFVTKSMLVDFYTSSTQRDSGACPIYSITPGAFPTTSAYATFVNAYVASVADGDYMYVAGNYGNEIPGLRLMIDDGTVAATFQSLSTTTYPEHKAHVHYGATPGTAEAITTNRIQNLIDDIESYGGGNVDFMTTSNAVYLSIGEMMRQENMITNMGKKLDTGWSVIEFNGIPIYKDPYSIDHLYMIDKRAIKLFEAAPQGWLDYSTVIQQEANKDNWTSYWAWYMTPGTINRQWLGKMQDISVTSNKF